VEILECIEDLPFLMAEVGQQNAGRRAVDRVDESRVDALCECGRTVARRGRRGTFRYPLQECLEDGIELQRAVAEQQVGP
jgi:hypothetical protein